MRHSSGTSTRQAAMDDPESGRNVWLRRRVPELLVEVVLIVFAVLLALAVDECRQEEP
jgi:hypothetical protein